MFTRVFAATLALLLAFAVTKVINPESWVVKSVQQAQEAFQR